MSQPVRVFLSYSHADDEHRVALSSHLRLLERQGLIQPWFDRKILPGQNLDAAIERELERCEVVLFLVSADFLASDYCYGVEMTRAMERHEAGEAIVVPLIVRACDWHSAPFGKLLALPAEGEPVTSWSNQDEAWTNVARELRRLIDDFGGRAATAPAPLPSAQPDPRGYLEALDTKYSWVKLQGMGAKVADRLPLDRIYTRLRVSGGRERQGEGKDRKAEPGLDPRSRAGEENLSLAEVLRDHPSAVLVGDPGSGKTTFLAFAAQKLARAGLGLEEGEVESSLGISGDPPFPIHLRLSELAEFLVDHLENDCRADAPAHLMRYLDHSLRGGLHGLPDGYLRRRLEAGGCFVLLDGLDEVPASIRGRIASLVDQTVAQLQSKNRFLLTCRTRAYEGTACLATLQPLVLADFGPQEVESFVRGWCRALLHVDPSAPDSAAAREAEGYRVKLQEAIDSHPDVAPLTRNPLMLTMLAVVHWNHHKLPEQRAALYAVAVDYLMESRSGQSNYTSLLRREALQALALAMFDDPEGLQRSCGLESAAERVQEILGVADRQAALDFLEDETLFSGLLVSQTAGEVEFWHLTFQEYLAALELASTGDWRELPEETLFADQWNEVILLLGGCLRQKNGVRAAKKLIQKVLVTGRDLPTKARAVGLAGRILRDLRPYGGDPAAGTEYAALLRETLAIFERPTDLDSPLVPETLRIEVGEALGQAGDPRLEEEKLWVDLPGGRFLMGAQSSDPWSDGYDGEAYDEEAPVRWVTLSPFRIGRYPVTVAQFRQFVEDREGGYQDKEIRELEGWAWRENERVTTPGAWSEQLRHPNWPVTKVSWYEADAYCNWRGVQLPTEAQWEFAARGEEGRKYPWGKEDPTEGHVALDGRENTTTPVGIYPLGATPEGIADLAGNVWEWCADRWEEAREGRDLTDPLGPSEGPSRVVRGGSFVYGSRWLRGAFRYGKAPEFRSSRVGFRVVFVTR